MKRFRIPFAGLCQGPQLVPWSANNESTRAARARDRTVPLAPGCLDEGFTGVGGHKAKCYNAIMHTLKMKEEHALQISR